MKKPPGGGVFICLPSASVFLAEQGLRPQACLHTTSFSNLSQMCSTMGLEGTEPLSFRRTIPLCMSPSTTRCPDRKEVKPRLAVISRIDERLLASTQYTQHLFQLTLLAELSNRSKFFSKFVQAAKRSGLPSLQV